MPGWCAASRHSGASRQLAGAEAAGTTAGLLALVFDDKTGSSSDSIFDVAAFLDGIGMPYQQGTREDIYQQVLHGFEASERLQLPYALLVDADDVHTSASFTPTPLISRSPPYVRNVAQHFVGPVFAEYQHQVLMAKQRGNKWQALQRPSLPVIPDGLPEPWPSRLQAYLPFFDIFRSLRGPIVTGDTSTASLFALPPYNCVDLTTYIGGSIPLAIGAHLAGYDRVWALTGDFSLIAAGQLGLLEAVHRAIPLKLVIFHNGRAEATGGQPIPPQLLDLILGDILTPCSTSTIPTMLPKFRRCSMRQVRSTNCASSWLIIRSSCQHHSAERWLPVKQVENTVIALTLLGTA
jgi:TPP-dependent indolepyruvate ferredoxin oxidoreductase alpha subunit